METENHNPVAEATWELWHQDMFDRECPRKVELRGQGLVQGLAELWARHQFETVQAGGQKGFSRFNLWWQQKEMSIEISGSWEGMIRLRGWVFGNQRPASQGYLGSGDQALLREVALAHSCLVLAGNNSEPILIAAKDCDNLGDFKIWLLNMKQMIDRKDEDD